MSQGFRKGKGFKEGLKDITFGEDPKLTVNLTGIVHQDQLELGPPLDVLSKE
jgi:hypothetical protein